MRQPAWEPILKILLAVVLTCALALGCGGSDGDDSGRSSSGDDDDAEDDDDSGDDDSGDDDDECQDAADELYVDCNGSEYFSWPANAMEFISKCECGNANILCYMEACYQNPKLSGCMDQICCGVVCGMELRNDQAEYCDGWEP